MKRRTFLKTAMAASAGGLASGLAAETSPAAAGRIKIGFLGMAHSHAAEKLKVVRESSDWELVGICEEDEALRRRCVESGVAAVSPEQLLEQSQVIAVESNVQDHARQAKIALSAGKHVHLEKPPADTLEAFRELLAMAREKNVLVQMGYMWRHHPAINAALEAARKGWLGDVHQVRGVINTQIGPERRPQWGRFRGGTLFELGCHLIDPLVRLMGRPIGITSTLKTHGPHQDQLADNTVAVFEFARALGIVSSTTLQPGATRQRCFEILGTNGTAVVRPIEPAELTIDLAKAAGPYKPGVNTLSLPPYRRYVGDFAELASAVRRGSRLSVTPEEDLLVQETLIRACT
jgi:predicted dehydrogenase